MPYPNTIQALINLFSRFPGIGQKGAQRYVFHLLRQPQEDLELLAESIKNLKGSITTCNQCHNYSDTPLCKMCADPSRDKSSLCVVAFSHEVQALELSDEFHGHYHVLNGYLNILDGITPEKLNIKSLVEKITQDKEQTIKEIILAFNPDMEGEATGLYLYKILKNYHPKITRLARGLPRNADIEYADEITLADALRARRELS